MAKRQKKFKFKISQGFIVVFAFLTISYNNCSQININGALHQIQNNSEAPDDTPSDDPKADTVIYDPSKTKPATCVANGSFGSTTTLFPTNMSQKVIFQGKEYSVKIVSESLINCDMTYTLDPLYAPHVEVRNPKFQGFYSFRIRTPKGNKFLRHSYFFQNAGSGIEQTYLASVSKYPGDIDPSRPNSKLYCNIKASGAAIYSSDEEFSPEAPCHLYEDAIYYVNVFYPDKPYAVPNGYQLNYEPLNNMDWMLETLDWGCTTNCRFY